MIRVSNVKFKPKAVPDDLQAYVAELTGFGNIVFFRIAKKSVDARKKENLCVLYSFDLTLDGDEDEAVATCPYRDICKLPDEEKFPAPFWNPKNTLRPVIVGTGPAGMLAGLLLAQAGANPILIERGKTVSERREDVNRFWKTGVLNEDSNVQFGEGGAGTFSDGKLTTGIKKDTFARKVLEEFVAAGAPVEIMYLAKPHIGTDRLFHMVGNIRRKIMSLGGEYRFETQLTDLIIKDGRLIAVQVKNSDGSFEEIPTNSVILSIGHSARDTFEMLYARGVQMIQKPFAIGTRIEHRQAFINKSQYGMVKPNAVLGQADYKLAVHLSNGRGLYTFCMCPGGTVVAAASEAGRLVTNGMSEYARDKDNANSALLVDVKPEDFGSNHPLAGVEFQRKIEENAFKAGGGSFRAPVQRVVDFLHDRETVKFGEVVPSYRPGGQMADMRAVLPDFVIESYKEGFKLLDRKIRLFSEHDALLTAAETRTSSPVRMIRDPATLQSVSVQGLYPCGEGAGYAGGIMSAAVDGLRCAIKILQSEDKGLSPDPL
ncbi:MAG: FAD-dependent monooxygenase [Alphaproteobacteria bacterium]|nr:FAD-dependent monooxygenase [Alphaproteobacteria bacterium]